MTTKYRVLALDQSSSVTGWALFEDSKLTAWGKFNSGGNMSDFAQQLSSLLVEHKPNKVLYEEIYHGLNLSVYKKLAQLQGVVLSLVPDAEGIYPTQWKTSQYVKGQKRPEQKRAAQAIVLKKYGIKATQDESDAILIGAHVAEDEINWT